MTGEHRFMGAANRRDSTVDNEQLIHLRVPISESSRST